MAAGDNQLINFPGQQCAIGRVVVATATNAIRKMNALHDIRFLDDILTLEQPRLTDAGLWSEVDNVGVFESRHALADETQQCLDAPTPLNLCRNKIFDCETVQPWKVPEAITRSPSAVEELPKFGSH